MPSCCVKSSVLFLLCEVGMSTFGKFFFLTLACSLVSMLIDHALGKQAPSTGYIDYAILSFIILWCSEVDKGKKASKQC